MANNSVPYLCGGVFFTLLLQVKYTGTARNKVNSRYDGVSDPELMAKLINVVTETQPNSSAGGFSKDVSKYRNCLYDGGKNVPFNHPSVISSFDFDIKSRYTYALNRMIDFTDSCILSEISGRMDWLIKALLSIIDKDTQIAETDEFHIFSNGNVISKAELRNCSDFELQSFLLGVLHYIITKPTINKLGQSTYAALYPSRDNHVEGKFEDTILSASYRPITYKSLKKEIEPATDSQHSHTAHSNPEVDNIDDTKADTSSAKIVNQYIQNPTIVNQNAEKIYNIEHVDHLD